METKTCKDCGVDISHRGNRAIRCTECQNEFRKQRNFRSYDSFLFSLNKHELTALVSLKRNHIKASHNFKEIIQLRTEIKHITEVYKTIGDSVDRKNT